MENTQKRQIKKVDDGRYSPMTAKQGEEGGGEPNKSLASTATKNFEKYEVIVDNEQLEREMRLIEWRSKTDLPLVKILFYKILQKKLLNECSVVQLAIQNFTHNLYTLPKMAFYQVLYLLKQALVGFERLYDRFGPFEVTQKMILVNKNSKCRVWINQNITLNYPGRQSALSENEFLVRILKLFEEKCARSILVIDLFQKIASLERMVHAIHYLETYLRGNRIVLPSRLLINAEQPFPCPCPRKAEGSNAAQREQGVPAQLKSQSFGGSQVRKIPRFVLNLREERKSSTSIDQKAIGEKSNRKAMKRNHSQVKAVNRSLSGVKGPGRQTNPSHQKSNNSPISGISLASRKDKSSNGEIISRTSLRNLVKQSSQQYLNPFLTMTSRKTLEPAPRLQKRPSLKEEQAPEQHSSSYLRVPVEDFRCHLVSSAKDLYSIHCSQQTATTINQSSINEPEEQPHRAEPEEASIFEKNGWMRRVNKLTEDEGEMAESLHEGNEILSSEYARSGQELALLGVMGKEVRGSLIAEL